MKSSSRKKLAFVTTVYWFLLLYIIAALIFWFTALEKQNRVMSSYKINELKKDDPSYIVRFEKIMEEKRLKSAQYLGEGIVFLSIILVGALFVYRAVRR